MGLPQHGVVTDAAHNADLRNFQAAADWASEGYPDDDYLSPGLWHQRASTRQRIDTDLVAPGLRWQLRAGRRTTSPMLCASCTKEEHDDALYPAALIHAGVYRNFCVMNLLTMLDERNLNQAFVHGLIVNAVWRAAYSRRSRREQQLRHHRERLRASSRKWATPSAPSRALLQRTTGWTRRYETRA